jgi:hypothetical protein
MKKKNIIRIHSPNIDAYNVLCDNCVEEGYLMDKNGNIYKPQEVAVVEGGGGTNTVFIPIIGEMSTKNIFIALGIGFLFLLLVNKK